MAFKKREEFYSNVGLEPAGNIGRANNSNAVVDGQRPHLGEGTGDRAQMAFKKREEFYSNVGLEPMMSVDSGNVWLPINPHSTLVEKQKEP